MVYLLIGLRRFPAEVREYLRQIWRRSPAVATGRRCVPLTLAISRRSPGRILGAMMYSNPTSGSREPGWRFQAYWLSRHNDGHHGNKIPEAGVGRERVQKRAGEGDHSQHRTFRSFDADMIIAVIFAHI